MNRPQEASFRREAALNAFVDANCRHLQGLDFTKADVTIGKWRVREPTSYINNRKQGTETRCIVHAAFPDLHQAAMLKEAGRPGDAVRYL